MEIEEDIETLELGVKSAKVASLVALTQIASIVISGIMLIVLARLLQPTLYGIYTLAYSVSVLFSAFGLSGVGHYLNKHIPMWIARRKRDELQKDLGASYLIVFSISALAAVVGIGFSGVISTYAFHSTSYMPLIALSLVSILFTQLVYLSYNALIGFKDGVGSSLTYSLWNVAVAVASISLVVLGYGVFGAILGIILGSIVGIIAGLYFILKHSRMKFEVIGMGKRAKKILSFSLPVAAAAIVPGLLNNFSVLFLGVFSTAAIIGSFGVSYRIGTIVITAAGFIASVLVQMFASALESKNSRKKISKLYNYSIYFGTMITVPVAVYLIVLSRPFVISLFPAFRSSLLYTPTLAISLLIGMIGIYASALAISNGDVHKVFKYAAITGVVQLLLLLALVPLINAYGIIIGVYLAGSLVSDYLYINYMKRDLHIETEISSIYRMLLASVILALVLAPINFLPISQTLQLVVGGLAIIVVYPILLGITKALGTEQLKLLRAIGQRTPGIGGVVTLLTNYMAFFVR